MEQGMTFRAPWGALLKVMTSLSVFILVGVAVVGVCVGPRGNVLWILGMVVIPLLMLVVAAFFTIRGYALAGDTLLVQRLGWNSKVDLSDLTSVEIDPQAMIRSIRTFGNGGMFCFAGAFHNKKLGSYRVFATDPKRSVVLKCTKRVVVVTPDRPEEFAAKIRQLKHL